MTDELIRAEAIRIYLYDINARNRMEEGKSQTIFSMYKLIQLLLPRQEELEMSWGIYVYVPV